MGFSFGRGCNEKEESDRKIKAIGLQNRAFRSTLVVTAIAITVSLMFALDQRASSQDKNSVRDKPLTHWLTKKNDKATASDNLNSILARQSFVFFEHVKDLKEFEKPFDAQPLEIESRPENCELEWLVFVRCDPSPTDRLCLAICQPKRRFMLMSNIELRQFGQVIYRGPIKGRLNGPAMQFVELRLPKKIYTDVDSLIAGLKKGDREAIDFRKQHKLPALDTLLTWSDKRDSGPFGFFDHRAKRFLYIESTDCLVK